MFEQRKLQFSSNTKTYALLKRRCVLEFRIQQINLLAAVLYCETQDTRQQKNQKLQINYRHEDEEIVY